MPLYEYKCAACDIVVEVLQRHSDPAPSCEACAANKRQAPPMKKLISATSFKLNGAGWAHDSYGIRTPTH